ncbi:MAG: hypothetical protein KIS78_10840 [Labilithrix sp.]|nr:hypothetical protein [Labilithrix sp.]MCW5832895.1 hypothetical protein [Labilithrix sp.]
MPRGARALGAIASLTAALAACNAISGLDEDYQLASGPTLPDDDAGVEGGTDAQAADADASIPRDGDAPDAPGTDAGLDCNETPPAPPGWSMVHCDNFDDTSRTAPTYGWTRAQNTSGAPVVEDGGYVARGLRANVTTGAPAPGQGWVTSLWQRITGGVPDGAELTVRLRFKAITASINYSVIGAIQLNNLDYGLALYRSAQCPNGATCLDENDGHGGHPNASFASAVAFTPNHWYLVEISVKRAGTAFSGKVVVDGAPVHEGANVLPPGAAPQVEVGVGAFFSANNGSADVVIDDVIVWLH